MEKFYLVEDLAVPAPLHGKEAVRTHEFLEDGVAVPFDFYYRKPTKVPVQHALRLVGNQDFVVRTESGKILKPKPKAAGGMQATLAPNQVVAELDELTASALFTRASKMKGGDKLDPEKSYSRTELIEFIMCGDVDPDADAGDGDLVDMDDEEHLENESDTGGGGDRGKGDFDPDGDMLSLDDPRTSK